MHSEVRCIYLAILFKRSETTGWQVERRLDPSETGVVQFLDWMQLAQEAFEDGPINKDDETWFEVACIVWYPEDPQVEH